jgi:hypothetical protein
VSHENRRSLLWLLDAMDDHFDSRITDQQFLHLAASARDSLDPSAAYDPGLAVSVRALDNFLSAAGGDALPVEPYEHLRLALADLQEPPSDST